MSRGETQIPTPPSPVEIVAESSEIITHVEATKIEAAPLTSAPTASYTFVLKASGEVAESFQNGLTDMLQSSLLHDKVTPLTVELVDDRQEPRGRMSTDTVSLIVTLPTQSESLKVFGHELGHVIDLQYLKLGTFHGDPSEIFYGISWSDYKTKKK